MTTTSRQINMLRRLAVRPLTVVDMTDEEITITQGLVRQGLVYDFADFKGRRIPINLRIWGIKYTGRAVLEQQALVDSSTRRSTQLPLSVSPTHPLPNKPPQPTRRVKPLTLTPDKKEKD